MPTGGDGVTLREGIADGERDATAATEKLLEEAIEEGERYAEGGIAGGTGLSLQVKNHITGGILQFTVGCLFSCVTLHQYQRDLK